MAGMSTAGLAAAQAGEDWHYVGDTDEPAFNSGWSNAGTGSPETAFRIREVGVVDLFVSANIGTGASPFTLPEGYRPSVDTLGQGVAYSTGGTHDIALITIGSDGTVDVGSFTGATLVLYSGSFWLTPPDVAP